MTTRASPIRAACRAASFIQPAVDRFARKNLVAFSRISKREGH